jgi:hypothetical protein
MNVAVVVIVVIFSFWEDEGERCVRLVVVVAAGWVFM